MTGRPLLTLDLDGVICRPPFGINPGQGRNKRRDAPGKKGILWRTESWRYRGRRPMPGAREGILALLERYDCAILSARAGHVTAQADDWFRRFIGVVPPLHFRPHWSETSAAFKARMLTELQPIAHFEDDPHTARWAAELVPAVFLVDWPRNRWLEGPGIHRIHRLAEALPTLEALTATEA